MRTLIDNLQAHWRRFLTSRHSSSLSLSVRSAAYSFRSRRSEYYRHVAFIIEATKGKKKIKQIFLDDVQRYRHKRFWILPNPRGTLSKHWAQMFDKYGGRYGKVFEGTLPDDEVMLIRLIQQKGGDDILPEGLRDLAATTALVKKAVNVVKIAIFGFFVPFLISAVVLTALPLFIVPQYRDMAGDLPPELYPARINELFAISDFLSNYVMWIIGTAVLVLSLVFYSLPRLKGRVRRVLNNKFLFVWATHRDFEAVKFLSNLSLVIKTRGSKSEPLKDALEHLRSGARPWKADLIDRMSENLLHRGMKLHDVFKVGLLDQEVQDDLDDMIIARGLNEALEYIRPLLEEMIVAKLAKRCKWFMWTVILSCAVTVLYLFVLSQLGNQDLQQAVLNYFSQ